MLRDWMQVGGVSGFGSCYETAAGSMCLWAATPINSKGRSNPRPEFVNFNSPELDSGEGGGGCAVVRASS